tara:strand:- start:310 stop:528 length:219 start_codon:yes stop_codon:yes gene_type:complete
MGWADWMVVDQSLEEELELEKNVRDVQSCSDRDALQELCVSLVRTNWHQAKLLQQAVGHIAELDASDAAMGL